MHLGLPKSGSSFFQAYLDGVAPRLKHRDVAAFIPREIRDYETVRRLTNRFGDGYCIHHLLEDALRLKNFRRYVEDAVQGASGEMQSVREVVRQEIEALVRQTPESAIWISDEAMLHYMMPTRSIAHCGEYIAYATKILEAAFGQWNPTIVLVVRRQDTYIESCYYQWVRLKGIPWGFRLYLAKDVNLARTDWFDLAERLSSVFGRDRIRLVPFESVYASPATFISNILKSGGLDIGVDEAALAYAQDAAYPAPSGAAIRLIRVAGLVSADWQTFNERAAAIERRFPRERYAPARALTERQRRTILAKMSESNERLFDSYLADFPDYRGYYLGRHPVPATSLRQRSSALSP